MDDLVAARPDILPDATEADLGEAYRASDVLTAIARDPDPRLTLDELVARLGDRAFGVLLLILALFNCVPLPPGLSTVFGATMMLVALQLMIGRHRLWLPGTVRRRTLPRHAVGRVIARVVPVVRKVEALCRPRAGWLASGPAERLIGLLVLVLAFIITLPIPIIGNIPPGIAVSMLAISLIERDGWAVLAGAAAGAVAIAVNVATVSAILYGAWQALHRLLTGS